MSEPSTTQVIQTARNFLVHDVGLSNIFLEVHGFKKTSDGYNVTFDYVSFSAAKRYVVELDKNGNVTNFSKSQGVS